MKASPDSNYSRPKTQCLCTFAPLLNPIRPETPILLISGKIDNLVVVHSSFLARTAVLLVRFTLYFARKRVWKLGTVLHGLHKFLSLVALLAVQAIEVYWTGDM